MARQTDWRHFVAQVEQKAEEAMASAPSSEALTMPAYNVVNLPWAAKHQNKFVLVLDNPQGQARSVSVSNGTWHWISEVDGSDLGAGNADPS
jgi:hypothetical protein